MEERNALRSQSTGKHFVKPAATRTVTRTATAFRAVSLNLHSVECVRTTKEVDADEIAIVGLATRVFRANGAGRSATKASDPLSLGKFRKGEIRRFAAPKTVGTFSYGGDAEWPRIYPLTLLLVEKDEGQLGTIAARVADAIDEKVAEALKSAASAGVEAAAVATGVGASAGPLVPVVGNAIGKAVASGVMAASAAIQKSRKDDVFPPEDYALKLGSAPVGKGPIEGTRRIHRIQGFKGVYELTTSWSVE